MKSVAETSHWIPASVRVSLLVLAVGAILCGALLRRAGAQVDGTLLDLGSRLMAFPDHLTEEERSIELNGISLSIRAQVVRAPLSAVLGHYQDVCSTGIDGSPMAGSIFSALSTRSGISDEDGYVACIDLRGVGLDSLVERLSKFSNTWDLADLGPLRYAYARQSEGSQTFVLTMWTDGSVNLRQLVPAEDGDAVGRDPAAVPRLSGTRRLLSAAEVGEPTGVFIYSAEEVPVDEAQAVYRRLLSAHGWTLIERHRGESLRIDDARVLHAGRGQRLVTVIAHPAEAGATIITLLTSSGAP